MAAQVIQVCEEELTKARGPRVHHAEAVPARLNSEEGLDLPLTMNLSPRTPSKLNRSKNIFPSSGSNTCRPITAGCQTPGSSEDGNLGLFTRIEIVEEEIEPDQTLVAIWGSEVQAVVVVKERAQ